MSGSTDLPTKFDCIDLVRFQPPPGCQNAEKDAEFPTLLAEVTQLRKPPAPLRVFKADDGAWHLADRGSWLVWSALQSVGSGISLVPPECVVIMEGGAGDARDVHTEEGEEGPQQEDATPGRPAEGASASTATANSIRAAIDQGGIPSAAELREWATELGLVIDLPAKYPTKEAKQAAWERIKAAFGDLASEQAAGSVLVEPEDAGPPPLPLPEVAPSPTIALGVQMLRLTDIILDPAVQSRISLDQNVIDEYAEAMTDGVKFPPIVVFGDDAGCWVADGFHRVEAALRAGLDTIEADVRAGAKRDAILHAIGANSAHGLRRTNEDKRRAVEMLLADPEWSLWSDREIARRAGVTHPLVGKIKGESSGNGYQMGEKIVRRGASTYSMTIPEKAAVSQASEPAVKEEADAAIVDPVEHEAASTANAGGPDIVEGEITTTAAPDDDREAGDTDGPGGTDIGDQGDDNGQEDEPADNVTDEGGDNAADEAADADDQGDQREDVDGRDEAPAPVAGEAKVVAANDRPSTVNSEVSTVVAKAPEPSLQEAFRVVLAYLGSGQPAPARMILRKLATKAGLEFWVEDDSAKDALRDLEEPVRKQLARVADEDYEAAVVWLDRLGRELGAVVEEHRGDDEDGDEGEVE